MDPTSRSSTLYSFNWRQFLKSLGLSGISLFASCLQNDPIKQSSPTSPPPESSSSLPTPMSAPLSKITVAIGQSTTYEPLSLRQEIERKVDGMGGLNDLVKPGARIGIKVNLTGDSRWDGEGKPPATEFFVTHPAVVSVLSELLLDMGAGKLFIMDGIADEANFEKWGYTAIAKPLGAQLINLCKPDPYRDFQPFSVGPRACVYDQFYLNPILNELDVFVSIGKMKCHANTGVTLSLKNLIGITPISRYQRKEHHTYRSEFHESVTFDSRLPRVILDLNQVRPIHLAIIDGIVTAEGGVGPWDKGLAQVKPGVLIAGKDPVATDAVATAVRGFDPNAPAGTLPFVHSDNHLALACEWGLGTNLLDEIGVAGAQIQDVLYKFKPAL